MKRPLVLAAVAVLSISCLACPGALWAQETPALPLPPAPQATPPAPQELENLGAAFPHIAWDSKARGVLLVIAPDKVVKVEEDAAATPPEGNADDPVDDAVHKPLYAPRDRYGLNAGLVARHFQRKLIHLPTMTVFAPLTMMTLNRDLKPINPFLGMSTEDKMRRLESSLTPEQWKTLGSENGLGLGDLDRTQQPLFEELLPESAELQRTKVTEPSPGFFANEALDGATIPITAEQRLGLRLRLDRSPNLFLVSAKGQQEWAPSFHDEAVGTEKLELVTKPDSFAKTSSLFGQQVRFKTPNRLKPGDLDLKSPSLEVWVPVGGAATVGDLVVAARKATGLDLYADGRLSRLPVKLNGGAAPMIRAADLLEALCWALTATYRKVGPVSADAKAVAYVLTYDREGLATRRGLIGEWGQLGTAQRYAANQKFDKGIRSQKPGQYLSFTKGNLLNPTPEAEKAVADFVPKPDEWQPTVPLSTLTAAQRTQMQAGLKELAKQREENPNNGQDEPRADRVGMQLNLTMTIVIPGVGEVHTEESWTDNTTPEQNAASLQAASEMPKSTPVHGANVILAVAPPRDRAEAESLVQTAVAHGIKQLWIHLPNDGAGKSTLPDVIAAGQVHHLLVGAIVGLMRVPTGSLPPIAENINIYGETGPQWSAHLGQFIDEMQSSPFMQATPTAPDDIVDPTAANVMAKIKDQVATIAATPGLSGLALCDAIAPGYRGSKSPVYVGTTGSNFGYTVANRLTFLKQQGYDPIDLEVNNYLDWSVREVATLPFFDTDGGSDVESYQQPGDTAGAVAKWQDFRADQETAALKTLRTALLAAHPTLPVYLTPGGSSDGMQWGGFYRPWDKPDTLPLDDVNMGDVLKKPALMKNSYFLLSFHHSDFEMLQKRAPEYAAKFTEAMMLCTWLRSILEPDAKLARPAIASGAVLDLSAYSMSEVLDLTKSLFLPIDGSTN